ncbi:5 bisphosphate carboxylase/oxygenase large subunit N-methyltransferase [Durusdinium trenchii]|uniref:Chloroplastic ([Fructose-bisphosphate aldolase]-lysine N-methyltransferase) ([Ribulose-bisphosphate carboxylase]-lysine N-methyltransferase) (PsLSMT) (RuBisCO LSMT) (RuBisCO methyltransferase) (RbcMT) n=1 Tax=Durusdinium trenchii TaxID=1381693 RepID=A0ABP0KYE4_9DINO
MRSPPPWRAAACVALLVWGALRPCLVSLPWWRRSRSSGGRRLAARAGEGLVEVDASSLALWLLEHGEQVHPSARLAFAARGGRGIWSLGALEKGAEVARIPWKLLLTQASAKKALGEEVVSQLQEYPCIALQLIHEKYMLSSKSFWHAYLEMLPSMEEIGASFTWPEEDLKLLDGSLIKNMSRFLREKIEEEYLNIAKNIFPSRQERFPAEVFTKERFLWAYAVLLSRSFRLRFGNDEVIALVPFIDFMNHDPDSKAYVSGSASLPTSLDGSRLVLLKTDRPYGAQEQIFDSYGRRSNDELLLLYGFSLPQNIHNFVEISLLELWAQTDLAPSKKKWLSLQGVDVDEMQSLCLPRGYWPRETMLLMRLLVLSARDVSSEGLKAFSDLGLDKAFDPSVERKALQALKGLCTELLAGCPAAQRRADAEARAAIEAEPSGLGPKERYAIWTRSGEVTVLETNLRRIDRLIEQIPFVFELQEARRRLAFPGLTSETKPKDFDIFFQEFALDD